MHMHLHMSAPKGVDAVKAFEKLCKFFDGIATFITTVLMIFLTVLITVSVISRWIFNSPITWQYEATLVCLSWVVFIGMSITFRQDEHMRLTFVSNAIKNIKIRNIWLALTDVVVLIFLVWGGILSIQVVENAMGTVYQTIPVSRGIFYLPFPIGCVFSVCHIINTNYKRLRGIDLQTASAES